MMWGLTIGSEQDGISGHQQRDRARSAVHARCSPVGTDADRGHADIQPPGPVDIKVSCGTRCRRGFGATGVAKVSASASARSGLAARRHRLLALRFARHVCSGRASGLSIRLAAWVSKDMDAPLLKYFRQGEDLLAE